jgi:hypothetical protein
MGKVLLVLLIGILGGVFLANYFSVQITPKSAIQPTEVPNTTEMMSKGSVDIELGYPSEGVPALKICVFAVPTKAGEYTEPAHCETTVANQTEATMNVDPGNYHIFAWPVNEQLKVSGSWTPAVACGLEANCNDHSPLPLTVKSSQITSGIEIKDWYGNGVGYPTKP